MIVSSFLCLGLLACTEQKPLEEQGEAEQSENTSPSIPKNENVQLNQTPAITIFPNGDAVAASSKSVGTEASEPGTSAQGATSQIEIPTSSISATSTLPVASVIAADEPTIAENAVASTALESPGIESAPSEGNQHTIEDIAVTPVSPTPIPAPEVMPSAPIAPSPVPAIAPTPVVPAPQSLPVADIAVANEDNDSDTDESSVAPLIINELSSTDIIAIQPKLGKSSVNIGRHKNFKEGAYRVYIKWKSETADSKALPIEVKASKNSNNTICQIDQQVSADGWRSIGKFYLTKNAKIEISNKKNGLYTVKNELKLEPIYGEKISKGSSFECLEGQITGHGLVDFH